MKNKMESKKILSGISSSDFIIESSSQKLNFKRGRSLNIGVNKNGNPFILVDGVSKQKNSYKKVDVKLEFTSSNLFSNFIKNCFALNEEVKLEKKEFSVVDSVKEGVSLDSVVFKCVESSNEEKIQHTILKKKLNVLPTYKVEKITEALRSIFKNKNLSFVESKDERNLEIKKFGFNKNKSLESKGFIVNNYLIENEDELADASSFLTFLSERLKEMLDQEYSIEIQEGNDVIKVSNAGSHLGNIQVKDMDFTFESFDDRFQQVLEIAYKIQDEYLSEYLSTSQMMNQVDVDQAIVDQPTQAVVSENDENDEDEEDFEFSDLDQNDDEIINLDIPSEDEEITINLDLDDEEEEDVVSEEEKEDENDEEDKEKDPLSEV